MPKHRTADQLADKLIQELDSNDIDTPAFSAGERDCYYCFLSDWVLTHKFEHSFGPEACLAKELQRAHIEEDACMVRLWDRHLRDRRTHAERMFRLHREIQFRKQECVALQANTDQLEAQQRDLLTAFRGQL